MNDFTSSRKCWRSHGTAVNCVRWVTSCRQTQSRKSLGSTSSLPLGLDDVRRDQQQLAGGAGEHLVLAEHLAGQVGEDGAGLHAGRLGADQPGDAVRRCRAARCCSISGVDHLLEPGDVARRPSPCGPRPGPADDRAARCSPVYSLDVLLSQVGQGAQLADHLGGLGERHLGARLRPARPPWRRPDPSRPSASLLHGTCRRLVRRPVAKPRERLRQPHRTSVAASSSSPASALLRRRCRHAVADRGERQLPAALGDQHPGERVDPGQRARSWPGRRRSRRVAGEPANRSLSVPL